MLSLRSPGSRYQDEWQLLGKFLYTSSPPEPPAGPDTMVAIEFSWSRVLVDDGCCEGCCDGW